MTHLRSKRLPGVGPGVGPGTAPGAGRTTAAVVGLVAALGLGLVGEANAVAPAAGDTTTTSAARWSDQPHGFASLAGGTTGGAGGKVVTVTDQASLARYAAAPEPYIIRVQGTVTAQPFGANITVASDKTIVGVGTSGELVQGEFHLEPGTHNVIIRNMTIRDSAVEGNWDCKDTDFDGIQMDTVHHVWVDHNRFSNICDGQLDVRKDSEYVTVSYNRFENNNKTFGLGWTSNVKTQITIDHNWFAHTKQRNPSVDNAAYAHLYNNYLTAQADPGDPVWTYGNWSRGRTRMVIENSYYRDVQHPYQADTTAELVERGSILKNTTGRHDEWGAAFEPREFYDYRLDPAAAVPALVTRFSGPQRRIGDSVTLHVPGDYATVQAAVDAVPDGNTGRVTIAVAPGTYREKVLMPASKPNIVLQGTGHDRSDTVIVFDTPAEYGGSTGSATVRIAANDVTARNLTFSNDFDEAAHELKGEQALAMKTTGDRIVFENTAFLGNQDTLMTDSPKLTTVSRVYIRDSYIEGDVDFVYGRATTVIERSVIRALSRGSATNNGYITAASTWTGNPYGFLITRSRIVSDAPDGTYHLGRPWHPGGEPAAVAQVLIRETELPAAVKASPWTDMSGFSWRDARFAEYRNHGPGAAVTADRPQMSDEEARSHTVADYLKGADGWAPQNRR
ncbi:right-handed parallel beta-helix repeat-containing protein [Streptomyces sp. ISL-22]|uniref:pectinesterase family protein n=1 Tax=unclassified Streptomyces TaxID=2593676 RepID=UPI001BE6935B|nr:MULTISPECIES: pectinesterase family protein [unclassified Streptomyces]MBT2417735.1 right-handed parallel beta-helix repeat-containing protein [Streptomyces sp. ISL-24]MBT2433299.1 right-handed parallel beta-helix repeat-containing protein [Streptomyces sp. ISL-22]